MTRCTSIPTPRLSSRPPSRTTCARKIRDADEPIFIAVLPASAGQPARWRPQGRRRRGRGRDVRRRRRPPLVARAGHDAADAARDAAGANKGESVAAVLNDFVDRVVASDADDGGGGGSGSAP